MGLSGDDELSKSLRKSILRSLKSEDHRPRKELRKACILEVKASGSKEERKSAFEAALGRCDAGGEGSFLCCCTCFTKTSLRLCRLVSKGKVCVEEKVVSRAPRMGSAEKGKVPKSGSKRAAAEVSPEREDQHAAAAAAAGGSKKARRAAAALKEAGEAAEAPAAAPAAEDAAPTPSYPPSAPRTGNVTILLFYAYCVPPMTKGRYSTVPSSTLLEQQQFQQQC